MKKKEHTETITEPLPQASTIQRKQGLITSHRHPVPDLVMILGEDDQPMRGDIPRRISVVPFPKPRVLSRVDKSLLDRFCKVPHFSKVSVISLAFSGEEGVEAVMEVVAPLGLDSVTARLSRPDHPGVIQIALRDEGIDSALPP